MRSLFFLYTAHPLGSRNVIRLKRVLSQWNGARQKQRVSVSGQMQVSLNPLLIRTELNCFSVYIEPES